MTDARLLFNGLGTNADLGVTLLEAARQGHVVIPRDCDKGHCESCRVRIINGNVDADGSACGNTVLACKARVTGNAELHYDLRPRELKASGVVRAVTELSHEIVEVIVGIDRHIPYLPGQYLRLTFQGLPERAYAPTLSLEGLREIDTLYFHIRKRPGGAVSSQLGKKLAPGTKVKLRGPFGDGFLRQVLVSSAEGFAALWSIAIAARLGQPHRPMSVVISAHDPRNLYMRSALDWLVKHDVSDILTTISGGMPMPPARSGRATAWLPTLRNGDHVHCAGNPEMIRTIQSESAKVGARVFATPFAFEGTTP